MKKLSAVLILSVGVVAGAAFVVACSDDSPTDADAAVCDCPAAEAPLAGRIVHVRATNPLTAGSDGGAAAGCPASSIIIGGACEVQAPDAKILLMESRFSADQQLVCRWSTEAATVDNMGTADAICLIPAP